MAKRRKNRTHLKGQVQREEVASNVPKSFIIKHGQVGSSINQLVRDMRKVMEPHTASRLKERNRNKLKDYITMGPALQVTHLLAFRLTPIAPSLKIIRLSDGPTLTFRVERYSLMKDILKSSRRAKSIGMEYLTPPLLVLANFPQPGPGTPQHLPLLMKSFQTLFPPLSPHTITLSSARRVVLVSYNAERGTVDFRHYLIRVKAYGVSKRVRRILEGASTSTKPVVNLGSEKDVADFLLRQRGMPGPDGYESASSAESEAGDHNTVELGSDYVGRNNKKGQKRAVRLDEVGPRLELRLVKITEGIPGKEGNVIYHEFVKKSKKEVAEQKANIAAKEKLRKERREEQERNVARKKAEADAKKKGKKKAGEEDEGEEEDEEMEDDHEMSDEEAASDGDAEEADDDDEWDDEEEITDGEDEEDEGLSEEENSESEDEAPPPKKPKFHKKR